MERVESLEKKNDERMTFLHRRSGAVSCLERRGWRCKSHPHRLSPELDLRTKKPSTTVTIRSEELDNLRCSSSSILKVLDRAVRRF